MSPRWPETGAAACLRVSTLATPRTLAMDIGGAEEPGMLKVQSPLIQLPQGIGYSLPEFLDFRPSLKTIFVEH